jgi:hypothetical protein
MNVPAGLKKKQRELNAKHKLCSTHGWDLWSKRRWRSSMDGDEVDEETQDIVFEEVVSEVAGLIPGIYVVDNFASAVLAVKVDVELVRGLMVHLKAMLLSD